VIRRVGRASVNLSAAVGAGALGVAREAGGITLVLLRVLRALIPPRFDARELLRNLYKMGVESVPIVVLTAFFTGGIMVIQAGIFVERFNARGIIGWAAGYATLREVAPLLIGLMFNGRVGANNTAELGTMVVTEQLDALRALAIDPVRYLVVPRVVAMVISIVCLVIMGDLVALLGAGLFSHLLLDVEYATVFYGMKDQLHLEDFTHGLIKAVVFGLAIALTSCHFGTSVKGGAIGVGRAVNNAVVAAAISIMLLNFFMTYLMR